MRTASDTNRSRRVWSGREGSEESVGGALESTKLSTPFKGAEDEFFGWTKSEDAVTWRGESEIMNTYCLFPGNGRT